MCLADESVVIQHIWESEEVACVEEEVLPIELIGGVWELAFFGACIYGGRSHNNLDYRKQSKRVIDILLVMRYRPYFF